MKRAHYSKRMLRKQDCVKFRGRIAWQSFFENNFADFSDAVQVKKKKKFKISSSRWWHFQLATYPTAILHRNRNLAASGWRCIAQSGNFQDAEYFS